MRRNASKLSQILLKGISGRLKQKENFFSMRSHLRLEAQPLSLIVIMIPSKLFMKSESKSGMMTTVWLRIM